VGQAPRYGSGDKGLPTCTDISGYLTRTDIHVQGAIMKTFNSRILAGSVSVVALACILAACAGQDENS